MISDERLYEKMVHERKVQSIKEQMRFKTLQARCEEYRKIEKMVKKIEQLECKDKEEYDRLSVKIYSAYKDCVELYGIGNKDRFFDDSGFKTATINKCIKRAQVLIKNKMYDRYGDIVQQKLI